MTVIRAGTVVVDGELCRPGWVQIGGARIVGCGAGLPPGPADVDLPNSVVVPGFVDMHVHGGGGFSFPDTAEQAVEFHRRHGTTTSVASLVTFAPADLLSAVRVLAEATRRGIIAGIHLEGPWLNVARCGAHDRTQLRLPDPAEIDALLAAADGTIRMVTLAPELPGSEQAIRRFVDANIVVAVGHTDATYKQTQHAVAGGATVATHLFNAMLPLDHRDPGPVLALLADPRVSVELIADGVHLHPDMVAAVIDTVGPERVAVITDATVAAGCGDGEFRLGSLPVVVAGGVARVRGTETIAGSTATMDRLFRAVADSSGLAAAVQTTSSTPARALRLDEVGAIRTGNIANLVVLEHDFSIRAVMTDGRWLPGTSAVC
ncbi:N-acetylglucosamine-6-phosphate deacetylase [Mycobacterium kiyosense]|uniref:N-acetylglucosamine-6-phosphate deacetylase n=1 Tax=Mycobacterium kiyosense TaxID=2871094 RepID=UPI001F029E5D|nr:N-acetylglucosamine-6-phosphate deacetylase [Mycobacterium kiyosense]BDB40775.1 N-acetylglucosamine-6-phosphate deacetylase [Mycobacterium kiyosense]GLB87974.1 N-acetylglucosamine-6-phosphate deacetylase [Mycobacterium kiyosense]GLC04255.1 N-acetylglucosamine-6-phosphate deacetylase [Mycobacterium kiyosense]GLC16246.1 N-acetylglucosamine-6-phosphate deacetylase [Mycobacterium kiyosense]GLC18675.1 N-acetylglucosamine-6-phosphate deacetylase [Mycobacterium kiyosense]